jgi:hypothetical protein
MSSGMGWPLVPPWQVRVRASDDETGEAAGRLEQVLNLSLDGLIGFCVARDAAGGVAGFDRSVYLNAAGSTG